MNVSRKGNPTNCGRNSGLLQTLKLHGSFLNSIVQRQVKPSLFCSPQISPNYISTTTKIFFSNESKTCNSSIIVLPRLNSLLKHSFGNAVNYSDKKTTMSVFQLPYFSFFVICCSPGMERYKSSKVAALSPNQCPP